MELKLPPPRSSKDILTKQILLYSDVIFRDEIAPNSSVEFNELE